MKIVEESLRVIKQKQKNQLNSIMMAIRSAQNLLQHSNEEKPKKLETKPSFARVESQKESGRATPSPVKKPSQDPKVKSQYSLHNNILHPNSLSFKVDLITAYNELKKNFTPLQEPSSLVKQIIEKRRRIKLKAKKA